MNQEFPVRAQGAPKRMAGIFFLGVCVGASLCYALMSSLQTGTVQVASNQQDTETPAAQPAAPVPPPPAAAQTPPSTEVTPTPAAPAEETPAPSGEQPREEEAPPAETAGPMLDIAVADVEGLWPARYMFAGLPAAELDEASRAWLEVYKPGGIALRLENIYSDWQTRDLVVEIKLAAGMGAGVADLPLVAVAEEGGPQANPLGIEDAPSASELGRAASPQIALAMSSAPAGQAADARLLNEAAAPIRAVAERYAEQLLDRGIAISLAPVIDVFHPGLSSPALRDRTYSADASRVSVCGQAFSDGLLKGGVLPVVKHYPGLGAAVTGDGGGLIIQETDMQVLANDVFLPFAMAAEWKTPGMLAGHIALPALDPEGRPASMSPKLIQSVLREKWNYDGVVLADDIQGPALGVAYPPEKAFVQALVAGCDAVIVSGADAALMHRLALALRDAVDTGVLTEERLQDSRRRLEGWQQRLGGKPARVILAKNDPPEPPDLEPPAEVVSPAREAAPPAEMATETTPPVEPPAEDIAPEKTVVADVTPRESVAATPPATEVTTPAETAVEEPASAETGPPSEAVNTPPDEQEVSPGTVGDVEPPQDTPAAVEGPEIVAPVTEENAATVEEAVPEGPLEPAPQPEGTKKIEHVIQRGDTLMGVARLYKVKVADVMAWNAMEKPDIKYGFSLIVYVPEDSPEAAAAEAAPPEPAPEEAPAPEMAPPPAEEESPTPAPVPSEGERSYVVQAGDALIAIAARFGVSTDSILKLNGLDDPNHIEKGQTLRIPPAPTPEPEPETPEE